MIELVWDQRRAGTATIPSGQWLTVGEGADFSPEELVSMAAAACLMRTCVKLAAESGIELLSFTATARPEGVPPATSIHVRVQMVTPDVVPEHKTLELWKQALRDSAVACVLGDRLVAEIVVTRLQSPAPSRG
jgi:organic hydroperoxide reductase OsmC/OhrA